MEVEYFYSWILKKGVIRLLGSSAWMDGPHFQFKETKVKKKEVIEVVSLEIVNNFVGKDNFETEMRTVRKYLEDFGYVSIRKIQKMVNLKLYLLVLIYVKMWTQGNMFNFGFTHGCLPMQRWDELNNFLLLKICFRVKVIFGLNDLTGRSFTCDVGVVAAVGLWNYANAPGVVCFLFLSSSFPLPFFFLSSSSQTQIPKSNFLHPKLLKKNKRNLKKNTKSYTRKSKLSEEII
ncbi:unnamed protein product [Vicia faba]|uniref:Uncharacterized protein n=1 Tax=Vicia faba TaxID=3906 RepID=A0AAV0YGF8_VICFA|nr:unnamed protein product [Vicia faba]